MQIAITIPDETVDEIDDLVPALYRSRAEVVRVALDQLLRSHRSRLIDQQYLTALDGTTASETGEGGEPDVGGIALRAGSPEPSTWADIPW